ncbi:MAG TPA: hypothetical protein VHG28_06010 [Longimicrobiaceae bacterium]|nr:hypothetical protein [Longimicrobiaceae bacterium]
MKHGQTRIDIGEVLPLDAPSDFRDERRAIRILEAARSVWGGFQLLFVHADGLNDPERVREEQVLPGLMEVRQALGNGKFAGIGIVPVRETEAWTLCDGDALRAAFRTTLLDEEMELPPRPRDVERIPDPKRKLNETYWRILGGSSRARGRTAAPFLALIGETINIEKLAEVPSFGQFRSDVEAALKAVSVIR